MTNEQINRAVAEELGWTQIPNSSKYWYRPLDTMGVEANFTDDHNAVAEMRKAVRPDEEERFGSFLSDEVEEDETTFCRGVVLILNITPFKQTRAFLRMRGKWIE
jgi:hypothetical protein